MTGDRPEVPAEPTVALDDVVGPSAVGDGVHWTLEEGEDLNANLVHLDPGSSVDAHVNGEVDVLFVVVAGTATLVLDDRELPLARHVLALAPKGARRSLRAGDGGVTYLTVHRRRGGLAIGRARRP